MNSHVELVSRYFVREPRVDGFFDAYSCSVQYVVADRDTGRCAIIDPVLNYDEKSAATATSSADALLAFANGSSQSSGFSIPIPMRITFRRPLISRRRRARGL